MKINFNEIKFSIKRINDRKNPNLLAYVTLTFKEEAGGYFTLTGFTLWKSKFDGYNVEPPGKRGFKYFLSEQGFWRKIKQEIIKQYEYEIIPIVEDDENK